MSKIISFAAISKSSNVDVEKGMIYDVIMCQPTEAKGFGISIDEDFIQQAVDYINKHFKKDGLIAHCDHDQWDDMKRMGKQLGVFLNVRYQDGKMIGDLKIYDSANLSPKFPGLKDWILSLAEEDKRAINSSIVFKHNGYYQRDENGDKYSVWYFDDECAWVSSRSELGAVFYEFESMKRCDLVTEGATTEVLFSENEIFSQFMDLVDMPNFEIMLEHNVSRFPKLQNFFEKRNDQSIGQKIKQFFSNNKSINPMDKDKDQNNKTPQLSIEEKVTALESKLTELTTQLSELVKAQSGDQKDDQKDDQKGGHEQLSSEEKINQLSATIDALKEQIVQLGEKPAADATSSQSGSDTAEGGKKESWKQFSIQEEADRIKPNRK